MKKVKRMLLGVTIGIMFCMCTSAAMAMADREGVNWHTENSEEFIISVFQAVLGRSPTLHDVEWARGIGTKTGIFWELIESQEYKSQFKSPREYYIYGSTKWLRSGTGGLERTCNCYYFAKFAMDRMLDGPYSFDVARSLVLMLNASDWEACPYYDCGYSAPEEPKRGSRSLATNNLVLDPNFANFGSRNSAWGRNVLYGEHGIWWNSQNANAGARPLTFQDGTTGLYIFNWSERSPHVYGTTAQRIQTVPGQRYRVSFMGSARSLSSYGALNIIVDPAWNIRPIHMPAGTYDFTEFSGTFTADSLYVDLRIIIEDAGEVWITGMTLQPIQ